MCEISIIVVNWNGVSYLPGCLESVMNQSYRDFEVIVVDNGSSDNSTAYIKEYFPQVIVLSLDSNRGFTGGNLAGYEVAKGRYIALLNNDTRVDKNWLEQMVITMKSDPAVGTVACRIIVDGTDMIDSAGDIFTSAFTGTKVGHFQPSRQYEQSRTVHGGCAAAILYRKSMLDEIGFLDDDFFFNHEDTDLNLRAWFCGWKCTYVPTAVVYHKVSATVGKLSDMGVYYFSRNNEWVWLKNVPFGLMFRFLPQRLLYEFTSALYFCGNGKWKPFIKGKLDALKSFNHVLKKRKKIQSLIKLPYSQIAHDLSPISSYLRSRLTN